MTIFFAGSEGSSFDNFGVLSITNPAADYGEPYVVFDTNYARAAIRVHDALRKTLHQALPVGTSLHVSWMQGLSWSNKLSIGSSSIATTTIQVFDEDGNLYASLIDNTLRVYTLVNGVETITAMTRTDYAVAQHGPCILRFECVSSGGSAIASMYLDGILTHTVSATGVTRGVKKVIMGPCSWMALAGYASIYSEVIIADESTIGLRVKTLYPTGNALAGFTGGFDQVDDIDYGSDRIYCNSPDTVSTFTSQGGTPGNAVLGIGLAVVAGSYYRKGLKAVISGITEGTNFDEDFYYGDCINYKFFNTPMNAAQANALTFGIKATEDDSAD